MSDFKCKINGKDANPPMEYRGIEIELNFEGDNVISISGGSEVVQGKLSTTQFTFTHENADLLNAQLLPGSLGVFWGIPIEFYKDNLKVVDAYIALSNGATFRAEKVTANILERKQKDWLNVNADGVDFRYFEHLGLIGNKDFVKIPYVLSPIPNYKELMILSLTVFILLTELNRLKKDILNVVADLSGYFTTISGVLKLIYLIIYLGLLIFSFVKLIIQMSNLLIQPVKYHYGMSYLKHFEAICKYFNFKFSSSYFQENIPTNSLDINGNTIPSGIWKNKILIPKKTKKGAFRNFTPKEQGFYEGTAGDFIRFAITEFNAKVFIINDTLHFERKDFKSSSASYVIPDSRIDIKQVNTEDFNASLLIEYKLDLLDTNTITRINGSNIKATVSAINKGIDGTQHIKGLLEILPQISLGKRKNELTELEIEFKNAFKIIDSVANILFDIADDMVKIIAKVVKAINKIIKAVNTLGVNIPKLGVPSSNIKRLNISGTISNRVGMLSLSDDLTGEAKTILIEGEGYNITLPSNIETLMSAEVLFNYYYYIESFVPSKGKTLGNQYYICETQKVPFSKNDLETIRGLNGGDGEAKIFTHDGKDAYIKSISWNIWNNTAKIRYAVNKLYDSNLKLTLTKNTGE